MITYDNNDEDDLPSLDSTSISTGIDGKTDKSTNKRDTGSNEEKSVDDMC